MGEEEEPVPWKEMFRSVSMSESKLPQLETSSSSLNSTGKSEGAGNQDQARENGPQEEQAVPNEPASKSHHRFVDHFDSSMLGSMNFQLALHIAMAHAGLLLLIVTLYSLGLLLKDFRKPIQWAVLCSITLREIQGALVRFWETPLQRGLLQTSLAIPFAFCKGLVETLHDAHAALARISGRSNQSGPQNKVGFSKLFQWLVTFGLLTLGYDSLGAHSLVTMIFTGLIAYAGFSSLGFFEDPQLSAAVQRRGVVGRFLGFAVRPVVRVVKTLNKHSTRFIAARLKTLTAIGLIVVMILGTSAGLVIFSYKAGSEAKDAVIGLKNHVQQGNYSELMGLRTWLEESDVPGLVEKHASTAFETVSQQIDQFGVQYNVSELTDAGKAYMISLARGRSSKDRNTSKFPSTPSHPVMLKLQIAKQHLREYNLRGIYTELEDVASFLLDRFNMKPEEVKEKVKQMSEAGAGIGKRVFSGSTVLLSGGTSVLISVVSSIASGAAGVFNFLTQAAVFFSLLYYLITSESGGVMEQALSMVPLSDSTRTRCATVLNHAVSSVLQASVKSAFFQGCFTWLLFRFFRIHFLYVSTLVAITTALLPVLPHWLASIPAAAQLALQGDYVYALLLSVLHFLVLDFGNAAIQDEIPGHNAHLAGLSIAGGMALFSPALEGAIMGPLLMTLLIALKNLYREFVLRAS